MLVYPIVDSGVTITSAALEINNTLSTTRPTASSSQLCTEFTASSCLCCKRTTKEVVDYSIQNAVADLRAKGESLPYCGKAASNER